MALDKRKLSKAVKDKYLFENETFKRVAKANPKDKIEVEIGDSKQPDFKPQFKVMRWDNEVNFSMRAEEHQQATVETDGEKIKYITPDYEVHQYDRPEVSEDGGFEFEWFLPKKPESNVLTATIQTKGLDFFYQPALTPEEIADGAFRPENVVGSYAVYHKTKGGLNDANGKDYKVGKAFHIYRPEAVDAQGNKTWCELNIDVDGGLVQVTVPQEFLDSAVYPVVVDPTFGYTSIGGTTSGWGANYFRGRIGTPAVNGSVDSVSVYSGGVSTIFQGKVVIVDSTKTIVTDGIGGTFIVNGTQWYTGTYTTKPTVSSGQTYFAGNIMESNNNLLYYDSGGTSGHSIFDISNSWLSPTSPTDANNTTRFYSIYATYTASGGSDPTPLRMLMGMGT